MQGTSSVSVESAPKGGFWIRFVAYLIDALIVGVPIYIVFGLILGMTRTTVSSTGSAAAGGIAAGFYGVLILAYVVYFVYFWSAGGGQTPGMRLFGLRVVKTDGSRVSVGTAILRYIGTIINSIIFGLPIGWIWAAFDKNKQGWHDKIAGTYVVKAT
jgi:uncharacterized RDD family membrane protein YckC